MCGIIGLIAENSNVVPHIMEGLKLLEYRGYDSAGLAVLDESGAIERRRASGKISVLEEKLHLAPLAGTVGIGHTRWATHGAATEANAHPHATERVAVIHNGIIENYRELKSELEAQGHRFESQTDSEVVLRLMDQNLIDKLDPARAVRAVMARLEGAFSLVFMFANRKDQIIGARRGSPLAVGWGKGIMCLGSDALAVGPLSDSITYLEDDDWVILTTQGPVIRDKNGKDVLRPTSSIDQSYRMSLGKGGYRHFMLKETMEQPQVVGDTLSTLLDANKGRLRLPELPFELEEAPRLSLVACGTSYYAALIGKYWIERLAKISVDVEVASEFRYRDPVLAPGGVSLLISQSGETADTLAALRHCKAAGQRVLSIVNVKHSSLDREAHACLLTMAGPEFGVASTKAFTAQLTLLAAMAIDLAVKRGVLPESEESRLVRLLLEAPAQMAEVLGRDGVIKDIAKSVIAPARDVLYLGRGILYPLALEGALKLKELSYIHAEGYAAGEIKHGPIALIDEKVPVVIIAPTDPLFVKTMSSLEEVRSRGGQVVFIGDKKGYDQISPKPAAAIAINRVDPFVAPIVYAPIVQLLAYHAAVLNGTDVDQPRNLAKSVTVE